MAKKFRFRLETVQRIRQRARDQQQRVLADAVRGVESVDERIARFTRQLESVIDLTRRDRQLERLNVAFIRSSQFYHGWLHQRMAQERTELARAQAQLDLERGKFGEATKRLKVIEKLRERQWLSHCTEVAREEQAALDEVGTQRYVRSRAAQAHGLQG